jgi:hypothetical protein
MFAPVARVTVTRRDGRMLGRTLSFPGDLDWWWTPEAVGIFATTRMAHPNRHALLPLLAPNEQDWALGRPLRNREIYEPSPVFGYPQPEFWARCLAYGTPSAVMNVIEISLPDATELQSLSLSTIGTEPALGLVALSAV